MHFGQHFTNKQSNLQLFLLVDFGTNFMTEIISLTVPLIFIICMKCMITLDIYGVCGYNCCLGSTTRGLLVLSCPAVCPWRVMALNKALLTSKQIILPLDQSKVILVIHSFILVAQFSVGEKGSIILITLCSKYI